MIFNLAVNNIFYFYSGIYSRGFQSISMEHNQSVTTKHTEKKTQAKSIIKFLWSYIKGLVLSTKNWESLVF